MKALNGILRNSWSDEMGSFFVVSFQRRRQRVWFRRLKEHLVKATGESTRVERLSLTVQQLVQSLPIRRIISADPYSLGSLLLYSRDAGREQLRQLFYYRFRQLPDQCLSSFLNLIFFADRYSNSNLPSSIVPRSPSAFQLRRFRAAS